MKLIPLDPGKYPASVEIEEARLPKTWPMSVADQICFLPRRSRLQFHGRMAKSQRTDLLALSSDLKYAEAINNLFIQSEAVTRWSVKDWLQSGEYIEKWDGGYKSIKYFAFLRSQDAKEFVILCPTFVAKPIVVRICNYGDLHIKSKVNCRFCQCPVEIRFHSAVYRKLRVCIACWSTMLTVANEIDEGVNKSLKTSANKKYGGW